MPSVALYAIIVAGSALLVLNPLVVYVALGTRNLAAFTLLIDAWMVVIILLGVLHLRARRRTTFWLLVGSIASLMPGLLAAEITFSYLRHQYADRLLGEVPVIFRDDPELIYTLIPNAIDRHTSIGNFDVEYVIDDQGRKLVPAKPGARKTVHVFGDSFTFGYGVTNDDTWPNLLSEKLGDHIDVLNYGVIGYSLEQMYLLLERHAENIGPGDLVIFAPIAADLERSLAAKLYVCGGRIRSEENEIFPKLENGRWVYASLTDECNLVLDSILANSPLQIGFGSLYRYLHHRRSLPAMVANADAIFSLARPLVEEHGAELMVIFLATPDECARGANDVELEELATPMESLLSFCPEPEAGAAAIRFPNDDHYNPEGHVWAAEAVYQILSARPLLSAGMRPQPEDD